MTKPIIVQEDPWLDPYEGIIRSRYEAANRKKKSFEAISGSLKNFASGYLYYGLHKTDKGWVFREWAPNATRLFLVGEFSNWKDEEAYALKPLSNGNWEIFLNNGQIEVGQRFKLHIYWPGGDGYRIPAYAYRCVQDEQSKIFDAQVWNPQSYTWKTKNWHNKYTHPIIYEAHIGMASEEEKVGSYKEFSEIVLPRIIKAGYNTLQFMAIQEHPYYGSFGYHVSNFFAASSRFGTPDELKALIDEAHAAGIAVIMDLVHSHAVKNEIEGLGNFAGDPAQYFHPGPKREHVAWDSLCFDYGKDQVMHFLLSNCRFWLEEYHFDGYRFDGVTSMLYHDHGLERSFTSYDYYFDGGQDSDAILYLTLANELIHEVDPHAISIAEEMSGMPGLAEPCSKGGIGFDYRLAMGIPDYWIKLIKERSDESWNVSELFHELTSRRANEKTIAYAESHDQALVGDKTIIFRLLDKEMYWYMDKASQNLIIDRGIALHKMIRLVTFSTSGGGYLNFMGNEFGHPEWIDFPREGNGWSYKYARRQWSLLDNEALKFHWLADFDKDMLRLHTKSRLLDAPWCNKMLDNPADQVLAYERNGLLFVFNFNPQRSFTDYGIQVIPGKYRLVLDTDEKKYGGFGNVDHAITYFAERHGGVSGSNWLRLYLPSRTALVFKHIPPPSIYEV
ncbi:MAG: alpha amylase C-terminal domain-containing protein [Bacteroidales bacterium]|nr:alpha amylase C-terminal domain-containing protein [Bacteroidales bacterium]